MLLSLLFSLKPTKPAPILGPLGRPANAWFLGLINRVNPLLAQSLHSSSTIKPYTISTLLDDLGRPIPTGKRLRSGEICWLRVTTYEQELSETLLERILPGMSDPIILYKMNFLLDGVALNPKQHPWAKQTSFSSIAKEIGEMKPSRRVSLEFISPTAFRSKSADIPLPIPAHVFRSYWKKWNAFSPDPYQIQDIWSQFVNDCVIVHELSNLKTTRWIFADGTRGAATGFTGSVGFSLVSKRHSGDWEPFWDGADRVLQTLAAFSFFCGTGHHTTIGLGQTRLIK
jgi:CRISPR-associated endoribonuclease Cas6